MPSQREDYLLSQLRQAGEALRRLREALTGEASAESIDRGVEEAVAELLGPRYRLLSSLDPVSAASLVADARRIELWSDLIRVQAAARRKSGDDSGASVLEKRAEDLGTQLKIPK